MIFLFPRWDMLVPWRVPQINLNGLPSATWMLLKFSPQLPPIWIFRSRAERQEDPGNPGNLAYKKDKGPRCVPTCVPTWSESLGHRVFCWKLLGDRLKRYHGWISIRGIPAVYYRWWKGERLTLLRILDDPRDMIHEGQRKWFFTYIYIDIARFSTGRNCDATEIKNMIPRDSLSTLIWLGSIFPKKLQVWDVPVLEISLRVRLEYSTSLFRSEFRASCFCYPTFYLSNYTLILIPKYVAHTYISFLGYCFIVFRDSQGLYWSWFPTNYTQFLFPSTTTHNVYVYLSYLGSYPSSPVALEKQIARINTGALQQICFLSDWNCQLMMFFN